MRFRLAAALLLAAIGLVATAAPTGADLEGDCEASGAFAAGTKSGGPFTVDARSVGTETVVVPRSDSVSWTGSVPSSPGAYSGSIGVDLPPPFGQVTIDSWEGTTDATENSGVEEYDLPDLVPAGVTFRVSGEHVDQARECSGFVNVEVEGGAFDSPVGPIVLLLTVGAGAGFFLAIRPLFQRVSA